MGIVHICVFLIVLKFQLQGISGQQYFRVKPQDTSVVIGGTAELRCHVGNRAGLVQWSKDGFLLGYDPDIPGYSRYEMQVDSSKAEYTLLVHNAQLDDEGIFQCQVGPGKNEKPIMSVAHLTILVPPKSLFINNMPDGSDVNIREGEKVILHCEATSSKPATILKWFRKNIELMPEASKTAVKRASEKLYTTVSTITLYPKGDSSSVPYTCEALHPALDNPQKTTVSVQVLHPTSPPVIEGYNEGELLQAGDTLTLTCLSTGGKPPALLTWHRNDDIIEGTYFAVGREAANTVVINVVPADNNAVYRCTAIHPLETSALSTAIRLSVIYPPAFVTINGPAEARRGDNVNVNCITDISNPQAEIHWLVGGTPKEAIETKEIKFPNGWITSSNVSATISRQETGSKVFNCTAFGVPRIRRVNGIHNVTIVYPPGPPEITGYAEEEDLLEGEVKSLTCKANAGYPPADLRWYRGHTEVPSEIVLSMDHLTSELNLDISPSDNGISVKCEVNNSASQNVLSATVKLSVFFRPKNVTITVDPPEPKEGEGMHLECWTSNSNPISTITWWREGKELPRTEERVVQSTNGAWIRGSRLSLWNIQSEDDGSLFKCEANANAFPGSVEDGVRVRVKYAPKFNSFGKVLELVEHGSGSYNVTARANPQVHKYYWSRDRKIIPLFPSEFQNRISAEGSAIRFNQVLREDAGEYKCVAENTEGTGFTTLKLNVLYPAAVFNISGQKDVSVGEDATFKCSATGNPLTQNTIYWKIGNTDKHLPSTVPVIGHSILTLVNVNLSDAGIYECWAHNNIGSPSHKFIQLNVLYSPRVPREKMKLHVAVREKETGKMTCISIGNPEVIFTWSFNGTLIASGRLDTAKYNLSSTIDEDEEWLSTLIIKSVEESDFGKYTCVARNPLGHDYAVFSFVRTGKPERPTSVQIVNITHNGALLKWQPGFDGGLHQHFLIRYRRTLNQNFTYIDFSSNSSSFYIQNLRSSTFYDISIQASNAMGNSAFTPEIRFKTKSPPGVDQRASLLDSKNSSSEDLPVWLWSAAVLGSLVVVVNVLCCSLYIKKYRPCRKPAQRREASTGEITSVPEEPHMGEKTKIPEKISSGLLEDSSPFYLTGAMIDIGDNGLGLNELQIQWNPKQQVSCESSDDGQSSGQQCECGTKAWGNKLICGRACKERDSSTASQHGQCPDILKRDSCHCHSFAQKENTSSIHEEAVEKLLPTVLSQSPRHSLDISRAHVFLSTFQAMPEAQSESHFIGPRLETVINGHDEES